MPNVCWDHIQAEHQSSFMFVLYDLTAWLKTLLGQIIINVSPYSGQGDVHGGKLWAKGRGAGVCKPTQGGTQWHDVTRPICDQVPLHRWRQDLPLGLGVEPRCQEGLELIEGESERDDAYLFFPSYLHLLLFLLLLRLPPLRPVKAVLQWLETEGSTSPPLPP